MTSSSDPAQLVAIENPADNRRESARYTVNLPAIAYPVLSSNEVDHAASITAIAQDISSIGLKLITDAAQPSVGIELVIGIERQTGLYEYCAGSVVASKRNSSGMIDVNIRFDGYMNQILTNDTVLPVLDRVQMQFGLPYADRTLTSLCKIGAMSSEILDNVTVCPHCQSLPTMRYGCSLCLSSDVTTQKMIHHFACANVDFLDQFETPDGLCCQKCRTKSLVIGSDYEYLNGPQQCNDCGKSNLETIQIGHCLNCEHRFPVETANQLEIVGYRVNRLEPLALIDTH